MNIEFLELMSNDCTSSIDVSEQKQLKGGIFSIFGLSVKYAHHETRFEQNGLRVSGSSIVQNGVDNKITLNYHQYS